MSQACSKTLPIIFIVIYVMQILTGCSTSNTMDQESPIFSFGLIADAQYADQDPVGKRFYRSSLVNLALAVDTLNDHNLSFVAHLGDLIDREYRSYDSIFPIYQQLNSKAYIVLGNHEFAVDSSYKSQVISRLGLTHRYYDFTVQGWRFLVLDGQGNSVFTHEKNSPAFQLAQFTLKDLRNKNAANAFEWNGGIDSTQMEWIKNKLDQATENDEKVVMFCHYPTYPLNETHNIWNDYALVELIDEYPVVKAYFNGHNHAGSTAIFHNVHFITLKGMVEHPNSSTFSIVRVYDNKLVLEGFGNEDTRMIPIKGVFQK